MECGPKCGKSGHGVEFGKWSVFVRLSDECGVVWSVRSAVSLRSIPHPFDEAERMGAQTYLEPKSCMDRPLGEGCMV